MNFGNFAIGVAFVSGLLAIPTYFLWARGQLELKPIARQLAVMMALGIVMASGYLLINIMTHQFQYEYIRNFSDRSLPTLLLASTFWGGQAGSFLLWAFWNAIFALILMWGLRRSAWEPFVLTPYLLVTVCIIGIMWASGPFRTIPDPPADGNGLNPLLQNYWMAIHPPILFTGFTTMAGPFAFAVAALWRRDYDGWVKMSRPWVLLGWACLGSGLALGGFWAYESLGWGGYWGWDPVENSSLVPWLFASALLHGLIVQGSRGSFKRTNLVLAIVGYLTVIYSTFLTRSGVLGDFSVHSFVELGLMGYLVAFMVGFAVIGFGLLAWRWRDIGQRVLYSQVLSREFGLILGALVFVVIALIVGIGTSMPVISLLPVFESQVSIDLGWYGPTVAPFGLIMLLAMAITPLLSWKQSKYGSLMKALKWPLILTGITLFACLLLNIIYPVAILFITASVFAIATNTVVVRRIWRAGPLKLGGYLSHIGVGLLFVGIIGTSVYKQTASLRLIQGEPQTAFGQQFTLNGLVIPSNDPLQRTAIQVEVLDPESRQTWTAQAPYYIYPKSGQLIIHPDIHKGWWSDLYLSPSQYDLPNQVEPGLIYMGQGETKQAFGYSLTFQEFNLPNRDAMMSGEGNPVVEAVINVMDADGNRSTITPSVEVTANQEQVGTPADLSDGATLSVVSISPESQLVALQFGNVDLENIPPNEFKATAFLQVTQEPGINLVWAGIIIGILGGLVSMIRRWRERAPDDVVVGAPQPRETGAVPPLQPQKPVHTAQAESEASS